ncbi:MAG: NAD(P)H-dependent oxidoreductase subunit E [Deltaproteobacteria bacterium]|nr:NAD(P)H-dependent oxidoreductase subunit E [Deltaproteobacteria bacterium]
MMHDMAMPGLEPEIDFMVIDRIINDDYAGNRENMIMIMQAIQREYRFLPEAALRYVAQTLDVPLTKIYEVATFYSSFSMVPKGKHILAVCTGTACHLKGGGRMVEHVCKRTGLEPGQTTADHELTLETVNCVGACAVAPVVVMDEKYHPKADINLINQILDRINTQ